MEMLTPVELAEASTLALIGLFTITGLFFLERVSDDPLLLSAHLPHLSGLRFLQK